MESPSPDGMGQEASDGAALASSEPPGSEPHGEASPELAAPRPGESPGRTLAEHESEVTRLEELLCSRASERIEAMHEVARLRGVLRDALISFERSIAAAGSGAAATTAEPVDLVAVERERELAVQRALEAEARCAEACFRLDEVLGHLAQPPAASHTELELRCAELSGAVRGLQAALAEVQEARDVCEARFLLVEQDAGEARHEQARLERLLGEAREELELARLQARARAAAEEPRKRELLGELAGQRSRCDEAESALSTGMQALAHMREVAAQRGRELGIARAELGVLRAEREATQERAQDLDLALTRQSERVRELASGAEQRDAELERLREQATRARSEAEQARGLLEQASGDRVRTRESLDAERAAARVARARFESELGQLRSALQDTRQLLSGLALSVDELSGRDGDAARAHDLPQDRTLPGMPISVEPSEAADEPSEAELARRLAEQVATTAQLRARLQGLHDGLRAVRESAADPVLGARLDALLGSLPDD